MDPISPVTAYLLETDTILAIQTWMSDRIRLVMPGARIEPLYDEEGYSVVIPYIKVTNNQFSVFAFEVIR